MLLNFLFGWLLISGCLTLLEILEIYWNNFSLLEILEIYWNNFSLLEILEIY